jgi:hypothetical protein
VSSEFLLSLVLNLGVRHAGKNGGSA